MPNTRHVNCSPIAAYPAASSAAVMSIDGRAPSTTPSHSTEKRTPCADKSCCAQPKNIKIKQDSTPGATARRVRVYSIQARPHTHCISHHTIAAVVHHPWTQKNDTEKILHKTVHHVHQLHQHHTQTQRCNINLHTACPHPGGAVVPQHTSCQPTPPRPTPIMQ